eukprot:11239607-Alexandrium_andersonii.AAC.1
MTLARSSSLARSPRVHGRAPPRVPRGPVLGSWRSREAAPRTPPLPKRATAHPDTPKKRLRRAPQALGLGPGPRGG